MYKRNNGFLKTIIILQNNIIDNFFNFDCVEQVFNVADSDKKWKVSYFKYYSILKISK